ncbi:MAG: hypothetical protein AB4080_15550 [Trichodesmium sp.]
MSVIAINNLSPVGADLLSDRETFLNELTDSELSNTQGGFTVTILAVGAGVGAGYAITKAGVAIVKAVF